LNLNNYSLTKTRAYGTGFFVKLSMRNYHFALALQICPLAPIFDEFIKNAKFIGIKSQAHVLTFDDSMSFRAGLRSG